MGPEESQDQAKRPPSSQPGDDRSGYNPLSLLSLFSAKLSGALTRHEHLAFESRCGGYCHKLFRGPKGLQMLYLDADNRLWKGDVEASGSVVKRVRVSEQEREHSAMGFFSDGKTSFSIFGAFDGRVTIHERPLAPSDNGQRATNFRVDGVVSSVGMSPLCDVVILGTWGGSFFVLNRGTEDRFRVAYGVSIGDANTNLQSVTEIDVSPDGSVFVAGFGNKLLASTVRSDGEAHGTKGFYAKEFSEPISSISFSPWENRVAVAHGCEITILSIDLLRGRYSSKEIAHFRASAPITSVCYSEDGNSLLFTTVKGYLGALRARASLEDVEARAA